MIWSRKSKRLIYGAFLTIFMLFSCGRKSDFVCQGNEKFNFSSKGFVSLEIDSLTSNKPYSLQYLRNEDKDLLSFINFHYNEIQLYDLESGHLTKKIKFDRNIYGEISGYFIHSLDSIFVVSSDKMKAFLVNSDFEEVQSFKIGNTQGSPISVSNLNVFYLDRKLYVINQFAIDDRKRVEAESLISVFDLENSHDKDEYDSFSFLSFPEIYDKPYSPELGLYFPAVDFEKRNIYLSFSVAHSLIYYESTNFGESNEFEMKPIEGFKIENSKGKNLSKFTDRQLYYLENHNYGNIVIDPFQELIFRIIYYPVEDAKAKMKNNREILKRRKLLISGLQNHQVLLEPCLDKELYYEGLMVGTPLGLLINKYTDDEDKILFEIFKIEENH